jgi:hypothetical protein
MEAGANTLVVEVDAFKETDVIYRAISSKGQHNDMLQILELVSSFTCIYAHINLYNRHHYRSPSIVSGG